MKPQFLLVILLNLSAATRVLGAELPVETFFRHYRYRSAEISPDGNYLAVIVPGRKHDVVEILDLKTYQANWTLGEPTADVAWFNWANTNRLLLGLSEDGYSVAGLWAMNHDGSKPVEIIPYGDLSTHFLSRLPNSPNQILVTTFRFSSRDAETGFFFPNVERVDLYSPHMVREVTNPGHVIRWLSDHNGVVRIGLTWDDTRFGIVYRPSTNAPWTKLIDFNYDEDPIVPVGFEYDNETLLVAHYGGQTEGYYTFDIAAKKIKDLAFRHQEVDAGQLIFSDHRRSIEGVSFEFERPEIFWFRPEGRKLQATLDKALPDTINRVVSTTKDESKAVILASSDKAPGTYYLLETKTLKLQKLFEMADWIKPEEMAEMKPIQYKARDGLTIHGYLVLPKGCTGKSLPLIVNPHGGPNVRDNWGFDPEAQFFANRGYAVFRMNFRGSTGYGEKFMKAGFKEWGMKQQDDITDGVRWAINEGIADPKRICIYGASYGGYATLVGLEETPELYRCGICYAGVTDILRTMKKWDLDIKLARLFVADRIGDPKNEKENLQERSPLHHVEKIRVPVLLAYGKLDPKVPIGTGRDMAAALKKTGNLYALMVKDDEGHGFHKEENIIDFYKKVDEFLKAKMN